MDFIQQLQIWAKGDALQGKIMFGIGIVLALCLQFILRGNHTLLKGMLIPLGLLFLMNLGYGGFLAYSRPKHLKQTQEQYQTKPSQTIKQELDKANTDHKNYTNLKPVWAVLLVISVVLFFFFSKDYCKGLSLGFMIMFLGALLIDTMLHHRLKPYLQSLQELIS